MEWYNIQIKVCSFWWFAYPAVETDTAPAVLALHVETESKSINRRIVHTLISLGVAVALWNHTKHNDRNGPRVGCWGLHTLISLGVAVALWNHTKHNDRNGPRVGCWGLHTLISLGVAVALWNHTKQNDRNGPRVGCWGLHTLISLGVAVALWNHTKHNDRNGPRVGCWGLHTHQPWCGSCTLKSHKTQWQEWTKGGWVGGGGVLGITHTEITQNRMTGMDQGWGAGDYTLISLVVAVTLWNHTKQNDRNGPRGGGGVLGITHSSGLLWQLHSEITQNKMTGMDQGRGAGDYTLPMWFTNTYNFYWKNYDITKFTDFINSILKILGHFLNYNKGPLFWVIKLLF